MSIQGFNKLESSEKKDFLTYGLVCISLINQQQVLDAVKGNYFEKGEIGGKFKRNTTIFELYFSTKPASRVGVCEVQYAKSIVNKPILKPKRANQLSRNFASQAQKRTFLPTRRKWKTRAFDSILESSNSTGSHRELREKVLMKNLWHLNLSVKMASRNRMKRRWEFSRKIVRSLWRSRSIILARKKCEKTQWKPSTETLDIL